MLENYEPRAFVDFDSIQEEDFDDTKEPARVSETEDELWITAQLPGLVEESLAFDFTSTTLVVSGLTIEPFGDETRIHSEFQFEVEFPRFELADVIDLQDVAVSKTDDSFTLRIGKREPAPDGKTCARTGRSQRLRDVLSNLRPLVVGNGGGVGPQVAGPA